MLDGDVSVAEREFPGAELARDGEETDSGQAGTHVFQGGSGGGANATDGGRGGSVAGGNGEGGVEGLALQGGCSSGTIIANGASAVDVASGGGAAQSSRIAVTLTGTVNVMGSDGYEEQVSSRGGAIYGGGAGGGEHDDGRFNELGPDAKILAGGGTGGVLATLAS